MLGDFDSFRELSDKQFANLQAMAETSPVLKQNLAMYEHISGRNLSAAARAAQEENDKRWDTMVADLENLPEEQRRKTMGAFSDMLSTYGFKLPTPLPPEELSKEGHFADFMNAYGAQGLDLVKEQAVVRSQAKCDQCGEDSGMRCKQCGEPYCSLECQKKAWPAHKKTCKLVAAARKKP